MSDFDLLVIGGGWGGYTAAQTMARGGGRVALVEQDRVGGVCLHRGCIPTKALLETAAIARGARAAPAHGVRLSAPELDWPAALDFKNGIVGRLESGMQQALDLAKIERLDGAARMTGPTSVEVTPTAGGPVTTLRARDVIIATGSRPADLAFLPVDGRRVVTSDHAIDLPPPGRAIIVGGGAVGAEFASLWTDLGSDVVLLELLPQLLPQEDKEAARALARQLTARGVDVRTGAQIDADSVRIDSDGVRMEVEQGGERHTVSGDVVLVATGRRPRSEALAPADVGVSTYGGTVPVDEEMRTDVEHVYAVGDVNGGLQLAHVAAAQGRYVAECLLGQSPPPPDPVWMPRAVYTTPEVASIGLTEAQAVEAGHRVKVGRSRFRTNARALIHDDADGFVKVVAEEESGDLLGCQIVGTAATEMIGQAAVGGFMDASLWELGRVVQAHPTVSEVVGEAAEAALRPKLRL